MVRRQGGHVLAGEFFSRPSPFDVLLPGRSGRICRRLPAAIKRHLAVRLQLVVELRLVTRGIYPGKELSDALVRLYPIYAKDRHEAAVRRTPQALQVDNHVVLRPYPARVHKYPTKIPFLIDGQTFQRLMFLSSWTATTHERADRIRFTSEVIAMTPSEGCLSIKSLSRGVVSDAEMPRRSTTNTYLAPHA